MGLSKPIVIASSNIDISNLATKSDMETLQNNVGAVKSVQRGKCPYSDSVAPTSETYQSSNYPYVYYRDITISAVNVNKASVKFFGSNPIYSYSFKNSTTLRVMVATHYNNQNTSHNGFTWEVTEFK